MKIRLPYDRGMLEGEVPDERISGVIESRLDRYEPGRTGWELVAESLRSPVGSPPLHEVARARKKVVLIASDHTRPVPSRVIVPQMLAEIRRGNPNAEVTILIATGCHRGTTRGELEEKFGAEIVAREKIVIHDCQREEDMVSLGTLPGGGELMINRLAARADLLVSEGFIEPHFFAGFSGGRKSVLPGIAAQKTVYANHCAAFIDDSHARNGVLEGNPIHRDMIFAAKTAGLEFIVNVVLNSRHEVIASFAGEQEQAHLAGTRFLEGFCRAPAIPADIVITSNNGYPLDQNIYQAVKGISTAELCCRPGGVIIMAAQCQDGVGGDGFYRAFAENRDAGDILQKILAVPQQQTQADQWQSQIFARALVKCRVILISDAPDQIVRDLHMIPAHSLGEALTLAEQTLGDPQARIAVIPEGISSIVEE